MGKMLLLAILLIFAFVFVRTWGADGIDDYFDRGSLVYELSIFVLGGLSTFAVITAVRGRRD